MPRKTLKSSPRKAPTQARSKSTVDAIVRAAAHILRTRGWEALTTNAVAKRAGVSIGSLYQYFPSKEAIVAALGEAHAATANELLRKTVTQSVSERRSLEDSVRDYIAAAVSLHEADPILHRILVERLPVLVGGVPALRRYYQESDQLVRAWLTAQCPLVRQADVSVMSYVLVTVVEAISYLELIERPKALSQELLVSEITQLVLGYIRRTGPVSS